MSRVVHCMRENYDIYIGRGRCPRTGALSKWANPYTFVESNVPDIITVGTRDKALKYYEQHILDTPDLIAALPELHGKVLGCWCKPRYECHGDILLKLLDEIYGLK